MSLLVLDGKGLACRTWFAAIQDPEPPDLKRALLHVARSGARRFGATHWCVAWETGAIERQKLWPGYKATRAPKPVGLVEALRALPQQLLEAGLPVLMVDGFEADDVMATLAENVMPVVLVTRDKDLLQAVRPGVRLAWPVNGGEWDETDEVRVGHEWGVDPDQLGDVLALMGDSVDNIPGVPKIGRERASRLIQEYGSLHAVLGAANAAEIDAMPKSMQPAIRNALVTHRDAALISRKLVALRADLPLSLQGLDLPLDALA